MKVEWSYYNKFQAIEDKYLPNKGEGETMATQIVTAVNRLVYGWYNNGDVFDNRHKLGTGLNDISSYANWLSQYTNADLILKQINQCYTEDSYGQLLKRLATDLLQEEYLIEMNKIAKVGSIYQCDAMFKVNFDDTQRKLYDLMENYFEYCRNNGMTDFEVWCEDNIDTVDEQALLDDIKEEVTYIADKLF